MKALDKGKWAEKQVAAFLEQCSQEAHDFAWHRFPDSKSARGALAAQPSDFLVIDRGIAYFIEAKETTETTRLPKAKIGQYGMLKKFELAGAAPYVIVYRSKFNDWTWFGPHALFQHDECPASFSFVGQRFFPTCADALKEIFNA